MNDKHPALGIADWQQNEHGNWVLEVSGVLLTLHASELLDFERAPTVYANFEGSLEDLQALAEDSYWLLGRIEDIVNTSVRKHVADQRFARQHVDMCSYLNNIGIVTCSDSQIVVETACGSFTVRPEQGESGWSVFWLYTSANGDIHDSGRSYRTVGEGIMSLAFKIEKELDGVGDGRFDKWTTSDWRAAKTLIAEAKALCSTNLGPT